MSIKNELEKSIPAVIKLTDKEKASIRHRVRQQHSSKIHLKPIIVSVFSILILAILMLPTLLQEYHLNNLAKPITLNHTNDSPIPLTEEQKQHYYEQYLQIVERAMERKVGISIAVPPMDEFKKSDWVVPKEYEIMIQKNVDTHLATEQARINAMSTNSDNTVTSLDGETTKATYIYFSDLLKRIEVTGSFETQYSEKHDRQLFASVNNVSTQFKNPPGTWEQTSYETSIIDGGQKYIIQIEGTFNLNNISIEKAFTIEFNCDEHGNIY